MQKEDRQSNNCNDCIYYICSGIECRNCKMNEGYICKCASQSYEMSCSNFTSKDEAQKIGGSENV